MTIDVRLPEPRQTSGFFQRTGAVYQIDGEVVGVLLLSEDGGDRYVRTLVEEPFHPWERLGPERARLYGDLYGTCIVCTGKAPNSGLHKECEDLL